jgi:flagellar biosynthesis protein FlhB
MADTFQEKTEQPTEKRLQEARTKGQVAQSKELPTCFIILFSSIFLYFTMSQGFQEMFKIYVNYVRHVNMDVDASNIFDILSSGVYGWAKIVIPFFALLVSVTLLSSILQTGFMWSFEAMQLKLENIDPMAGMKKLLSKRAAIEVLKSIAKIGVLAYVSYTLIMNELPLILSLPHKETSLIAEYLTRVSFSLSLKIGVTFLFVAGLDFLFQKWQFKKDLMMTQQEVKEEYKDREGNPLVKSRIRSLQREMSRRRMIEDVKSADVIVTNPTHFAIGLKYTAGEMPAPRIVAKGAGFVAQKIKEVASKHGVPLIENKPLAQALFYVVKVGDYIPEKFYLIVAELLAQVYKRRNGVTL